MKHLLVVSLTCLMLLMPFAVRAEVTDRVVAIVNDEIVTLREVERFVTIEKKGRYSSMNEYLLSLALRDKVDTFVEALLITQQAKKLKIEVDAKEVDGAIENIKKQNLITDTQLREQLQKENIDFKDFRESIRLNMIRSRVLSRAIAQDVAVDDKNLREYYNQHAVDFVDEEYKLQQIFISGQNPGAQARANEAIKSLTEGKPFGEVASDFSDEPSKDQAGDIGFVKKEELLPELREAIKLLIPGSYTRVTQTPYGFHILKLNEVRKGQPSDFESVKDKVKEALYQAESQRRYKEYIRKLRASAYVEVKM
jgi:peptidyl-prolyl cis-trans isomerase SurA